MNIFCLPPEIIVSICSIMKDHDKLSFLSTCAYLHSCKSIVLFQRKVKLENIYHLFYYQQFTNVSVNGISQFNRYYVSAKSLKNPLMKNILPRNLVELEMVNFNGYLKTWTRNLPKLRRLCLRKGCKVTVKPGCLPSTLTHLTWETNQCLEKGILPHGLENLKIDYYNHKELVLPSTLQTLHIGRNKNYRLHFDHILSSMLPEGMKTLILDCNVDFNPESLPKTITKVIYGYHNYQRIKLPSTISVTEISK